MLITRLTYRPFLIVLLVASLYEEVFPQWVKTAGLQAEVVQSLATHGETILAGTKAGLFLTTTKGETWTRLDLGGASENINAVVALPDGRGGTQWFAGTFGSGVLRTIDGGMSWHATNDGLSQPLVFTLLGSGAYLFAGTYGKGMFRSSNQGTTWTPVNTGLDKELILSLATTDTYLFAGTDYFGNVFRSSDQGDSWSKTALEADYVFTLAVHGESVVAGTGMGIFVSSDDGETWRPAHSGLRSKEVWSIVSDGKILFAATSGGVHRSRDDGVSWEYFSDGLTDTIVTSLVVVGEELFAGTARGGVWKRDISDPSTSVPPGQHPSTFRLGQNYPNPFNPETRIEFELDVSSHVRLRIFDLHGREIALLVSQSLPAGRHLHVWNAAEYPSGVYLCRLDVATRSDTRKLLLLR
jgi:hypothetical protein